MVSLKSLTESPMLSRERKLFAFIVIIGAFLVYLPIYAGFRNDFSGSTFQKAIANSTDLTIAHACCVAGALPMLTDAILDFFSEVYSVDIIERICCLAIFIYASLCFLLFSYVQNYPIIYIANDYIQTLILVASSYSAIRILCPAMIPLKFCIFSTIFHAITNFVRIFAVFSVAGETLNTVGLAFFAVDGSILFLAAISCFKYIFFKIYPRGASNINFNRLSAEELSAFIYVVATGCIIIVIVIADLTQESMSWKDSDSENLIVINCSRIFICIPCSIIPGRIARGRAIKFANKLLTLKKSFVRYVSHEIRSALNVSVAGLEMIKTEITATNADAELIDLVIDVYESNETAVEILNDLLHYESIDAGTFKIEARRHSLKHVFGEKIHAIVIAASRKALHIQIEDNACAFKLGSNGERILESSDMDNINHEDLTTKLLSCHEIEVDKFRIDQVLRNFFSNAIKFSKPGDKIILRTSFVTNTSESLLRVEVIDFGAGITPENHSKIFKEFSQIDQNELQEGGGSGLGLWICQKVIQLHGGKIGFISEGRNKGCCFYFEIPITSRSFHFQNRSRTENAEESSSRQSRELVELISELDSRNSQKPSSRSSSSLDYKVIPCDFESTYSNDNSTLGSSKTSLFENNIPKSIPSHDFRKVDFPATNLGQMKSKCLRTLIVDDSPMNRKIMRRVLESDKVAFGQTVIMEADDGSTAIEVLENQLALGETFDLILIDYIMTTIHGPTAVEIMRNKFLFEGCIIAVTGNTMPEERDTFMKSGANDVILKPLTKVKLMDLLAEHCLN